MILAIFWKTKIMMKHIFLKINDFKIVSWALFTIIKTEIKKCATAKQIYFYLQNMHQGLNNSNFQKTFTKKKTLDYNHSL